MRELLSTPNWSRDPRLVAALKEPLMRVCANYLVKEKRKGRALDRVAHFHLSNGARVERINWLADISPKGLRHSAGLMVNYRYRLRDIEANHEAYSGAGEVAVSGAVRKLLKPHD